MLKDNTGDVPCWERLYNAANVEVEGSSCGARLYQPRTMPASAAEVRHFSFGGWTHISKAFCAWGAEAWAGERGSCFKERVHGIFPVAASAPGSRTLASYHRENGVWSDPVAPIYLFLWNFSLMSSETSVNFKISSGIWKQCLDFQVYGYMRKIHVTFRVFPCF